MADEPNDQQAPAQVQDLGAAHRVIPNTNPGSGPTLEEQSALQDETPEAKAAREAALAAETPEAKATREAAEAEAANKDDKPAPVDFKGTVFEGLSPDMQGKIAPFAVAFNENGTLTDAEVSEAATATGFSEAAVRQFMAGATAEAVATAKPMFDAVGGQGEFAKFQTWTQEQGNLTDGETKAINKATNAGDYETAALLAQPAIDRWKAEGGATPARDVTREGQGKGGTSGDVYESWDQLQRDQNNPLYRTDPAFRAKVEAKVGRSPALD